MIHFDEHIFQGGWNHQLVKGEVETWLVYELYNLRMAISPLGA